MITAVRSRLIAAKCWKAFACTAKCTDSSPFTLPGLPVNHYARQFGQSKYGINRTIKVVLDLITIKFMSSYLTKPIYIFGSAGLWSLAACAASFAWMCVLKYGYDTSFIETPLPVLVSMFFMVGIQLILMGLLAEILVRTYHESQDKRIYTVKKKVNLD
jgi:dolichol-phosphate mannosyltransferase